MTRFLRNTTLIASVALVATVQPFRPVMVKGRSMAPTLQSGHMVLGTNRIGQVERGDVVVFHHDGENVVKRVAFVAGDSFIEMRYEDYWLIPMSDRIMHKLMKRGQPWHRFVVPEGYVYVIGDNPKESIDSRDFGPVALGDVSLRVIGPERRAASIEFPGKELSHQALVASR